MTGQVDESLDRQEADILGPDSSPYRGRVFRLNITILDRYVSVTGQVDESLDRWMRAWTGWRRTSWVPTPPPTRVGYSGSTSPSRQVGFPME